MNTEFCPACGEDRQIRREEKRIEYEIRGEPISLTLPMKICDVCETQEVAPEYGDPILAARKVYNQRHPEASWNKGL